MDRDRVVDYLGWFNAELNEKTCDETCPSGERAGLTTEAPSQKIGRRIRNAR